MDSIFDDAVNFGMSHAEEMVGDFFTFNGKTYTGVNGSKKVVQELADGGFFQHYMTTLIVRKSRFVIADMKSIRGKELVMNKTTYKIEDYTEDRNSFTLELTDTNQ